MSTKFKENLALVGVLMELAEGAELEIVGEEEFEHPAESIDESSKAHYPFKRFPHLGASSPGKQSAPDEEGAWQCKKAGKYFQICHGVGPHNNGYVKKVRVNSEWKKKYNHEYKQGIADGKYHPGARSGGVDRKTKKNKKTDKKDRT